jgi:hypothetical protein
MDEDFDQWPPTKLPEGVAQSAELWGQSATRVRDLARTRRDNNRIRTLCHARISFCECAMHLIQASETSPTDKPTALHMKTSEIACDCHHLLGQIELVAEPSSYTGSLTMDRQQTKQMKGALYPSKDY